MSHLRRFGFQVCQQRRRFGRDNVVITPLVCQRHFCYIQPQTCTLTHRGSKNITGTKALKVKTHTRLVRNILSSVVGERCARRSIRSGCEGLCAGAGRPRPLPLKPFSGGISCAELSFDVCLLVARLSAGWVNYKKCEWRYFSKYP